MERFVRDGAADRISEMIRSTGELELAILDCTEYMRRGGGGGGGHSARRRSMQEHERGAASFVRPGRLNWKR